MMSKILNSLRYIFKYPVRSMWSLVQHPSKAYWTRYFAKGYRKGWTETRNTGWKLSPNEPIRYFQLIGTASGTPFGNEVFYTQSSVDENSVLMMRGEIERERFMRLKVKSAEDHLASFLDPKCRCKVGWHWKCNRHYVWKG